MREEEVKLAKRIQVIKDTVLTPERQAHGDVTMNINTQRGGFGFEAANMPFDVYYKRRRINRLEFIAAKRLFSDFSISGQTPGMTINLDPIRTGTRNFTEAQIEARERWRNAILAVHGQIGKLLAINVCCYGYWLTDGVNNEDNQKQKSVKYLHYKTPKDAMCRFHEVLDDLIKHYDLTRN